jgi:phage-related tail fiber protein
VAILQGLTVDDTGFLRLPVGNTGQRPGSPVAGMSRLNTTTNQNEWYDGTGWIELVPTGAIRYFARNSAPDGWLKANGASVSTTTYANLFAVIAYAWGGSGGSFNVPDFRGEFPRVWDDGRGVDSGRTLTTAQDQDWKGYYMTNTASGSFSYSHGPVYMGKSIFPSHTGNLFTGYWAAPSSAWGTAWDTSPIRPRNVSLLACIKF